MKARIKLRGKGNKPSEMKAGISMPFELDDLTKFIHTSGNLRCPVCGGNEWIAWHEAEVFIMMDAMDHEGIRLHDEIVCVPHLARDIRNNCLAVSKRLEIFRGMVDCVDECCGCGAVFSVFSETQKEDHPSCLSSPFIW